MYKLKKLSVIFGLILLFTVIPSCSFADTCDDTDSPNYDALDSHYYNIYKKGTVTYNSADIVDGCYDYNTVSEVYCNDAFDGKNNAHVDCPEDNYCFDGACEPPVNPVCTENYADHLNLKDERDSITYQYDIASPAITIYDECKDDESRVLRRVYCDVDNTPVLEEMTCDLTEFCVDGKCELKDTDSCQDTDPSMPPDYSDFYGDYFNNIYGEYFNIYDFGQTYRYTTSGSEMDYADTCIDEDTVSEGYCDSDDEPATLEFNCPINHICVSGRCMPDPDLDCIDTDPPTEQSYGGEFYVNRYYFGSVTYIDSDGDTNHYYDSCDGQSKVIEVYCDSSGNKAEVTLDCPEGYACSGGQCTSTGVSGAAEVPLDEKEDPDCKSYANSCDACLNRTVFAPCDCPDECASGNCCDGTCQDEECGIPENCTWFTGPGISGNFMYATPGKVIYNIEENTLLEITGGTGTTLWDAEVELYATDLEEQSIYFDTRCIREDGGRCVAYVDAVGGYTFKDSCMIDHEDCPAIINIVLPKGKYEAQAIISSTFFGGLTQTTSCYTCVKKIKTNDCLNPNSESYCDLGCDHCTDGVHNCDETETKIDCGGSCVTGTETVSGFAPYYDVWDEDTSFADDYLVDDFGVYFSSMYFCMDGLDNDHDCLVDCDDPDCASVIFFDADGDGYGVGCGSIRDCDDTDPTETTDCDNIPPQGEIEINGNDEFTAQREVYIDSFVSDDRSNEEDIMVSFSNDGTFPSIIWYPSQSLNVWNVTEGDGLKTVYAIAMDAKGNVNSSLVGDTIILDTTPPIQDIMIMPNPSTTDSDIDFMVACTDPNPPTGSGSGCNYTTVDIIYPYSNFESTGCYINYSIGETSCDIKYVAECEDMSYEAIINTTDNLGNLNSTRTVFQVKKKEGCPCVLPEECISNSCPVQGFCSGDMPAPSLAITEPDGYEIPLGETMAFHVAITNNLPVKDTIKLNIYSDSNFMTDNSYFSKDSESRTETYLELDPMKTEYVTMYVFGGKLGTYNLMLDSESMLTHLKAYDYKTIHVVKRDDGSFFSRSPGLAIISIVILVIVGAYIYNSKSDPKPKRKSSRKRKNN